ncbi:hypothetical protein PsYK624_042390 [Phanerochaete sordida]|uniref:Alcohol acetyltransferase n=1 Tax=Phanerochaete sordida TaxID=48140 RepID=A0A9P3G4L4_9APHY|nr:hypothetical protein PsYK624_042390 [Phanerochaete sordida]
MERYHVLLGQLGFDSCVVIAGRYASESGASLTRNVLYPALRTLVHQHAALGVQIVVGATRADVPKFVRLPEVDLDAIVEFTEDTTSPVDELLRTQLGRLLEFGTSAPLWRVTVVNGSTVFFAFHHVIADGQSGPALLATLLAALNSDPADTSDASSGIVSVPQTATLAGPAEAYTDVSVPWLSLLHELYKMGAPKSWLPSATAWTGNAAPATPSLAMHVRCWSIPAPQTIELLRQCRAHATTLTAVLHTLLVGVLARVLAELRPAQAAAWRTVHVAVPVSLRRATHAPPTALCDHVSTLHGYAPLHPLRARGADFPWGAARDFGRGLHARVPRAPQLLGELAVLFRWGLAEGFFTGMLGKKRTTGLGLSNVGRFPEVPQEGKARWTLNEVYLGQCDVVRGAAIKVNVVGSPEGTTNITFTWGEGAIDEDLVEAFIAGAKETLDSMLGS